MTYNIIKHKTKDLFINFEFEMGSIYCDTPQLFDNPKDAAEELKYEDEIFDENGSNPIDKNEFEVKSVQLTYI